MTMSNNSIEPQVKFLSQEIADFGITYATPGSAAFDLRANIPEEELTLAPGECQLIPTGLAVWLENPAVAGLILPRSGLGHKHGVILGNGSGLIDSDYQNQLFVSAWNRSTKPYTIKRHERIAQYVVVPVLHVKPRVVTEFETETERGEGGFGSSGKI